MDKQEVIATEKNKVATERGKFHYAWIVGAITFLAILAGSGVRSTFGVFIKPIPVSMAPTVIYGWRQTYSFMALFGFVASALVLALEKDPRRVRAELAKAALPT